MVTNAQDNNYLYMVMELCRGGELLDVITYVIAATCNEAWLEAKTC